MDDIKILSDRTGEVIMTIREAIEADDYDAGIVTLSTDAEDTILSLEDTYRLRDYLNRILAEYEPRVSSHE